MAAVQVGDGADVQVEHREPAPHLPHERGVARVHPGEQHDVGAGGAQVAHGPGQRLGHAVGVAARPQQVVAAGAEADQVWLQLDRHRHLVPHDLVDQLAAHREVGVPEAGLQRGEALGHPVGPAPEVPVRTGVVEPLGEAVADRDVGGVGPHRPSSAIARSASSYDRRPNPAMVPLATEATTEVWRNSSRDAGLEMCTSISGAVRWAIASRSA